MKEKLIIAIFVSRCNLKKLNLTHKNGCLKHMAEDIQVQKGFSGRRRSNQVASRENLSSDIIDKTMDITLPTLARSV